MIKLIRQLASILVVSIFSFSATSAQISQQQIEQFKKLSKPQQQQVANSMGVDLNVLLGQISNADTQTQLSTTEVVPRSTTNMPEELPEEFKFFENDEQLFKPLERFGIDVFANAPSTFSPTMDIAIPEHYILGVGDKLSVQIYGKENHDYVLPIAREGTILIPDVGPIKVVGLTFAEMKQFLADKIKARIIGVNVVVSLAELRSMRVFVLGSAYKPGPYTLSSLSTVTHAIFAAGGISDIGSLRDIQVKRAGQLVKQVDLYDLLINGDSSDDILLQSGDVVFIPTQGNTVSIQGEVQRPAIYELKRGDDFNSVLAMAGGLLSSAYPQATIVERYNAESLRSIINIDLTDQQAREQLLQNGDYIRVLKSSGAFQKSITIVGAVSRPGKYQWQQNTKISDLLPSIESHLLANADLNYALIVREVDRAKNIEVLQFSLANAIGNADSKDNITLSPNDTVLIFSNVTKHVDEQVSLDELAYTQEQLFAKEREQAKTLHKEKSFWLMYGDEATQSSLNGSNTAEEDLVSQSLTEMTGANIKEELDIREIALFSRHRLLTPVLRKLRQQGASGQPIQLIEVDGEVKFPGVYPLSKNARVSELIAAAGGVNESAYLARAEITRNSFNGERAVKSSLNINLSKALSKDIESNIKLISKDRLNVHKIPAWSENIVVELRGEFVFPGKYTIRRGETLADLVTKAGGLTEYANADGSIFTRKKLQQLEQKNLLKLASDLRTELASKSLTENGNAISYVEAQKVLADLTKLKPVGRLVIELAKVMDDNAQEILLEGGDILYVPTKTNSINVIGQVQVSSSHLFDSSLAAEDYIAQSGGVKKRADEDRIYIISANGSIKLINDNNWFAGTSNSALQPGDTIVVPLDSEYMNDLTLWSTATQIIYNAAVAVAAINGL
ncbi:protein involved in polysaccharide export, contains SLBB domain of the beta-grasp fold [Colwellia chukchiensis]|uniref:Protein involved in polysaccharide export, contains SLBB domain of the beta-grasp fold n=1 Tax=Colwellia chukchiensis TaxID=641665 RepID=A0A1H7HAR6_9GAMM|nr:SLBB domain-containing protein [Colwellia chukchiensis]SEK47533.1 protein involved in polysaccharide export, contains SLBB domain of the beta-grasp fold [Colwellia chukchiensis]